MRKVYNVFADRSSTTDISSSRNSQSPIRCLTPHRKLIKIPTNPYSHTPKAVKDNQQQDILHLCQGSLHESIKKHRLNGIQKHFRDVYLQVSDSLKMTKVSLLKMSTIANFLVYSVEHNLQTMFNQISAQCKSIMFFVLQLPKSSLKEYMKKVKLQILIEFWCQTNINFVKFYGMKCITLFMRYFQDQHQPLVMHQRNCEVVDSYLRIVQIYLLNTLIQQKTNEQFQVFKKSNTFSMLPKIIQQRLQTQCSPSSKNISCMISMKSLTSHEPSVNGMSSESSRKKKPLKRESQSSLRISKMEKGNKRSSFMIYKRMSCQPDMIKVYDIQKLIKNASSAKYEISEQSEDFNGADDLDSSMEEKCIYTSKILDSLSCRPEGINAFLLFAKLNGSLQPVIIENVHLLRMIDDHIQISFRVRSTKVTDFRRFYVLKQEQAAGGRRRQEQFQQWMVQMITNVLRIRKTFLGYKIELAKTEKKQQSMVMEDNIWIAAVRFEKVYFFQCRDRTQPKTRRLCDRYMDSTLEEHYNGPNCVEFVQNYTRVLKKISQNRRVERPSQVETSTFKTANCTNKSTKPNVIVNIIQNPVYRQPFSVPNRVDQKSCLEKMTKLQKCRRLFVKKYGMQMKQGQSISFQHNSKKHIVLIRGFKQKPELKIELEIVKADKKSKKQFLEIGESEILCSRQSGCPVIYVLKKLKFQQTPTYPRFTLKLDKQQVIIHKFFVKTRKTYALICVSFVQRLGMVCFDTYLPLQRITYRSQVNLQELLRLANSKIPCYFSIKPIDLQKLKQFLEQIRQDIEVSEENEQIIFTIFQQRLEVQLILASKSLTHQKSHFLCQISLDKKFSSCLLSDTADQHLNIKFSNLYRLTKDLRYTLQLTKQLSEYFSRNEDVLLNPIHPQQLSCNTYRFCYADLRRLAANIDIQKIMDKNQNDIFLHIGFKICRAKVRHHYISLKCLQSDSWSKQLSVQDVTDKIQFFDKAARNLRHERRRARILAGLHVALPSLFLP